MSTGALRLSADVAIVGSGFAGSLTALALRRMGRDVVLLERERHPRFAIGESSTPLANLLLERLCTRYELDTVRPLAKWGTWQDRYPRISGGLKRGFSFFRHDFDRSFEDDERHGRQLLVAASPHDRIADTHWYRPDVDAFLAHEAEHAGAVHVEHATLESIRFDGGRAEIDGTHAGRPLQVRARFVIDASGPRGFLHRTLGLGQRPVRWMPPTEALYTHFASVERWEHVATCMGGSRTAPARDAELPFPPDDAALHHVFPGGWIWLLRFNNGVTSAGAALTPALAASVKLADPHAWDRLLQRLPSIAAQFRNAVAVRPFVYSPRVAFRSAALHGPRWALLPSAAGVIDPLLSTGFPLTLLGIERVLDALEHAWDHPSLPDRLDDYARRTMRELDTTEALVGALYATMTDFDLFKRLTRLYFAAASFSEAVTRLGRAERVRGFLLCDDDAFGAELFGCAQAALSGSAGEDRHALADRIDRAIEPFDIAGLRDEARHDWYPVRAEDLVAAAPKLGAQPGEIEALLERTGFSPSPPAQRPD